MFDTKRSPTISDKTSFDLECFDNVPLEKFPGFFLEIRNKKGIFSVIPNYIPISEIETYTFASLEKLFKTILKDWKFI